MKIAKSGVNLNLTWGASCTSRGNDYEVYEGTIGTYYSHAKQVCTTTGLTAVTVPSPAGNTYFLVVPRDGQSEGSYGVNSSLVEIPAATPAANQCFPQVTPINCN